MKKLTLVCLIVPFALIGAGCGSSSDASADSHPDPNVKGRSSALGPKMGMAGSGQPAGPAKPSAQ